MSTFNLVTEKFSHSGLRATWPESLRSKGVNIFTKYKWLAMRVVNHGFDFFGLSVGCFFYGRFSFATFIFIPSKDRKRVCLCFQAVFYLCFLNLATLK